MRVLVSGAVAAFSSNAFLSLIGANPVAIPGVPPVPSCPPGFSLEERGCIFFRHVPPILRCPKKSVLQGRDCVGRETAESMEVCPEGFMEKKGKCWKVANMQPELGCKNNYSFQNGGACVKVIEDEIVTRCPKGTRHTAKGCVRVEKIDVQYICPAGYEMKKNTCVKDVSAAAPTCSKDFELINNICIRKTVLPPRVSCPKGYKEQDNGCVLFEKLDFEIICREGEYDGKKHCRKMQIQAAKPSCPPGFVLSNGDCTRVQEDMPRLICHKGFIFDGEKCVKEVIVSPEYSCPIGTTQMKDKCTVFMSEQPALRCPEKFILDNGKCHNGERRPAEVSCPKGYTIDSGTRECMKSTTVKATLLCERGELKKGECIQHQTVPAEPTCSKGGTLTPEGCLIIDTIPPSQRCPKDFRMDVHGKCVTTDTVRPEFVCPPGFTRSSNKKGTCERMLSSPAAIKCPAGYEPSGTKCMRPVTVEAIATCPEGLIFHENTCIPYKTRSKKL